MLASSSTTPAASSKQKRILPTRTRRGGPGIGTCDADILILDTLKRRSENEPLVPSTTRFFLTTNSALIPVDGASETQAASSTERYFDRADVTKALKEQKTIQTPSFERLAEGASVGSRLRTRSGGDDQSVDTSDAAYEKRHRKFETFEKRQRLREKEKLKHEQYKLKERVEQLRAMDATAFMALSPSLFSARSSAQPGSSRNPPPADEDPVKEGERRRQELLAVASALEDRYATLLPSERKVYGNGNTSSHSQTSTAPPSEPHTKTPVASTSATTNRQTSSVTGSKATSSVRTATRPPSAASASGNDTQDISSATTTKTKLVFRLPPSSKRLASPNSTSSNTSAIAPKKSSKLSQSVISLSSDGEEPPSHPPPSVNGITLQSMAVDIDEDAIQSISGVHAPPRGSKRARRQGSPTTTFTRQESVAMTAHSASSPAPSASSYVSSAPKPPGVLMTAALHAYQTANSRKTSRGQKPFGYPTPDWPMEEYVLPGWIRAPSVEEEDHQTLVEVKQPGSVIVVLASGPNYKKGMKDSTGAVDIEESPVPETPPPIPSIAILDSSGPAEPEKGRRTGKRK